MNYRYTPEFILVDPAVESLPTTRRILDKYRGIPWRIADQAAVEARVQQLLREANPETRGKRTLWLTRRQGRFLKSCPGICDEVACCDYHIIDLGSNCPLECTYCVLQGYLNNPLMVLYMNIEELLQELEASLAKLPGRVMRVGTGELTDSLALDEITGFSRHLVPFFARQRHAILELKTKTAEIGNLLDLDSGGHTVLSWSINTPRLIAAEELKCCALEERLDAARQCVSCGYQVGFHFDPIVAYPGWEMEYRETVHRVFEAVPVDRIAWISLGALRLPPGLRSIIQRRFPHSLLPYGEFAVGIDRKVRYFRPIRTELYRKMAGWIRECNAEQTLYLCMENPLVWRDALGVLPEGHYVGGLLDHSVVQFLQRLENR